MHPITPAAADDRSPAPEQPGTSAVDWLAVASHGHDSPRAAVAALGPVALLHLIGADTPLLRALTLGLQAIGRPAMSVGDRVAAQLSNAELRALAPAGHTVVVPCPAPHPRHNDLADGDMVMRVQFSAGRTAAEQSNAIGAVVRAWAAQEAA